MKPTDDQIIRALKDELDNVPPPSSPSSEVIHRARRRAFLVNGGTAASVLAVLAAVVLGGWQLSEDTNRDDEVVKKPLKNAPVVLSVDEEELVPGEEFTLEEQQKGNWCRGQGFTLEQRVRRADAFDPGGRRFGWLPKYALWESVDGPAAYDVYSPVTNEFAMCSGGTAELRLPHLQPGMYRLSETYGRGRNKSYTARVVFTLDEDQRGAPIYEETELPFSEVDVDRFITQAERWLGRERAGPGYFAANGRHFYFQVVNPTLREIELIEAHLPAGLTRVHVLPASYSNRELNRFARIIDKPGTDWITEISFDTYNTRLFVGIDPDTPEHRAWILDRLPADAVTISHVEPEAIEYEFDGSDD